MTFAAITLCIVLLVILITWAKLNPFLAFLIVGMLAAALLGIPLNSISQSINKGIGDTLGSLVIVIVLGAMLGRLVAESGAARRIASTLQTVFGERNLVWAMSLSGFIVGIPLYYNVGFVLLVPIIFSVAHRYQLPLVYIGLPMLTSLSVMHGFLPPHPSPVALVSQFKADMATTFFYGTIISVPAIIIAGPLFSKTLKKIRSTTIHIPLCVTETPGPEPGVANSLVSSLLPILIIGITAAILPFVGGSPAAANVLHFIGEPNVALTITILTATYTLGIRLGRKLSDVMRLYGEAVKDIAMILLTIGSAGILKQIFVDSGANVEIGDALASLALPPLLLAWFLAAMLRLALGSATVAGLTAAGIIYPLTTGIPVNPNLLVLAIGAGSLFCSHVNDSAFWLFKEYFGLTMKDTFRSWTMMESLVSIIGLGGVLILDQIV